MNKFMDRHPTLGPILGALTIVLAVTLAIASIDRLLIAGIVTKPNAFTGQTAPQLPWLDADFDTLYSEFNGNIDDANIKSAAGIQQSKVANLVTDLAARLLKAGDTITGALKVKYSTPCHRFTGTEVSAKDWQICESAGSFIFQENTGTEGTPTWTTRYTLAAGAGGPAATTDLTTKSYVDAITAVLDRVTTAVPVNNTPAEMTIYTKAIAGGTLSTNRLLRLTIVCTQQNATGSSRDLTIRAKYGATTVGTAIVTFSGNATARQGVIEVVLHANNATNAQLGRVKGDFAIDAVAGGDLHGIGGGTAAIDSTASQNLVVTVQHEIANASITFTMNAATLEKPF